MDLRVLPILLHAVDDKNNILKKTRTYGHEFTVYEQHIKYLNLRRMGVSQHVQIAQRKNTRNLKSSCSARKTLTTEK